VARKEKSPTLRDFFYVLYKYEKMLIVFALASVLISVIYSYIYYPKYEATGKVLIEFSEQQSTPTTGNLGPGAPAMVTTMTHSEIIQSEIQLLRSRYIAEEVFAVLGERIMNPHMEEVKTLWQKIKRSLKDTMGCVVDGINWILYKAHLKEKLSPRENAILFIQKGLRAELVKNSNSIKVLFKSSSPALAADIVNEAISQYMTHRLTIHLSSTVLQFLENQTSYFKKRLDEAEASLRDFKNQWQVASLGEQISHLLKLNSNIKNDLYQNDTEIAALEGRVNSIETSWSEVAPKGGKNRITKESGLIDLLKMKLIELKLKRIDLATRYSDDNRLVRAADEEIANTERTLKEEEVETAVSVDIDALKSKKRKLNELLELSAAELNKLTGLDHQLRKLTRDVRLNESLYDNYFDKAEEARIIEARDLELISNVRLMESSFKPILPIRTISFIPQRIFNILMAFFVGVFVSASLVAVMEMFDHSFRSAEDVEEYLEIPVLGTISENRSLRRK
jgi:uncharacterized protein involved in exopolysaccharide biosynthesis